MEQVNLRIRKRHNKKVRQNRNHTAQAKTKTLNMCLLKPRWRPFRYLSVVRRQGYDFENRPLSAIIPLS